MQAHYHVSKQGKQWAINRLDQSCLIGRVSTRKEALQIARILAGWRGKVTQGKA